VSVLFPEGLAGLETVPEIPSQDLHHGCDTRFIAQTRLNVPHDHLHVSMSGLSWP
jgi:hypothetical protein